MLPMLLLACGLVGLALGSFLNVVIYRVPLGLSVVRPRSACPTCHAEVAPRDNVPVVSWLMLGGRCRRCKAAISARYPLVEALTAVLFVALAAHFGATWMLLPELAFLAGAIPLAACDLQCLLLPRRIVYPTALAVTAAMLVAASAGGDWDRLVTAAACGSGACGAFWALHAARPAWLGFGDVRLAGLIGLALGWLGPWYLAVALVVANLAGAAVGVTLMAAGRARRTTALPYGFFLTFGAVVAILSGAQVLHWYSQLPRL